MTDKDLSPHARQDERQKAYEIARRAFQLQNGRIVRRMESNR